MFLLDRLEIGLPLVEGQGGGYSEDGIPYAVWPLCVFGDAIWAHQCTGSFYGFDEPDIPGIFRSFCSHFRGWHSDLFTVLGGARGTLESGA